MLILGSKLENTPVLSLQTGSQLALATDPIVNPANLQIMAYKLESPLFDQNGTDKLLRVADIRELSKIGYIIDSFDEFISPTDVIKINKIYELNFQLEGLKVVDSQNKKLGIVIDFTLDLDNFTVQQLIVKRPIFKSFNDPELTIHRSQIISIDDEKIAVKSEQELSKTEISVKNEAFAPNYVNPFRNAKETQKD